jgi:hypothetical protein
MLIKVKYQIATYSGEVYVNINGDEEADFIIAKAKRILTDKSGGSLPYGYESFKIEY